MLLYDLSDRFLLMILPYFFSNYGIKIDTLDNPGWIVMIDVAETEYENKEFNPYILNNGENDWIDCKIENGCFIGAGDSSKLLEIVALFRKWIESV